MNESPARPSEPSPSDSQDQTQPRTNRGNLLGIMALLLVAAVGGWAAYLYITGKDGFSWKRFTFQSEKKPVLVAVTGQVFYNGQPMVNGVVQAVPVDPESGLKTAIGPLGKDGRFEMYTDVNGLIKGAGIGEYKVVLNVTHPPQPGQLAPTRVLPAKYYSVSTTPVTIVVTAEKKQYVIREKGEPAVPGPGGNGSKRKGRGKRPSAKAIIERIMANDTNGDGKISREEAPERLKTSFDRIDSDSDGFLDKQELEAGIGRAG